MKEETPHERKSCYDCSHLIARVNWWCGNKDAVKARGTAIPGVIHCPYWSPDYKMIQKEPIPHEEKHGYENPLEHGYTAGIPIIKGALFLIIFGSLVRWWPHILRMLNAIVQ